MDAPRTGTFAFGGVGAGATKAEAPATSTAWFTGVPAGQHSIALWVRSVTAFCTDNPGGFQRQVTVEEFGAP